MRVAQNWDVVIIGAGMAGLTTAMWARRFGLTVVVLEAAADTGGQLRVIRGAIPDYPGLPDADGPTLADRVEAQVRAAGAVIQKGDSVQRLDVHQRLCYTASAVHHGAAVVLATGVQPKSLGVPGEAELHTNGLIHRPSRELAWFRGRRVVLIGGGDRAVENALLVAPVALSVHLLHRGPVLRANRELQIRLRNEQQVQVLLGCTVRQFVMKEDHCIVELQGDARPAFPAEAVCIYVGNSPNTDLVTEQLPLSNDGYVMTDADGQTAVPGIYAVGDVRTPAPYQSLVTAAGQAMVVAKHMVRTRTI